MSMVADEGGRARVVCARRKAVKAASKDHAALDGEGVLARLRRRSMFPSVPAQASDQQRASRPPGVPATVPEQAAGEPPAPAQQQQQQQPRARPRGFGRLQPSSFRPPRPPQK
jgi:hypothetical protein